MRLQTEFIQSIKPVTDKVYDDMLGAVPPIRQVSNAFLVGEAYDHINSVTQLPDDSFSRQAVPRYQLYFIDKDGNYQYGGLTTLKGFDTWVIVTCHDCGSELSLSSAIETSDNKYICEACDTKRNIINQ